MHFALPAFSQRKPFSLHFILFSIPDDALPSDRLIIVVKRRDAIYMFGIRKMHIFMMSRTF